MKIEIVEKDGESITYFDLESNPFKVGEHIFLNINNECKEFWNNEELRGEFKIDKIEHTFHKTYTQARVYNDFCVSVYVTKV